VIYVLFSYRNLILLGDANIGLLHALNSSTTTYLEILNMYGSYILNQSFSQMACIYMLFQTRIIQKAQLSYMH
jgi:hypothetical protein